MSDLIGIAVLGGVFLGMLAMSTVMVYLWYNSKD